MISLFYSSRGKSQNIISRGEGYQIPVKDVEGLVVGSNQNWMVVDVGGEGFEFSIFLRTS